MTASDISVSGWDRGVYVMGPCRACQKPIEIMLYRGVAMFFCECVEEPWTREYQEDVRMSAEWDCQKHNTFNIGTCHECDLEISIHEECRTENVSLKIQLINAKHFIETLRTAESMCANENKNVHAENLRLEAEISEARRIEWNNFEQHKDDIQTYRAAAEGLEKALKAQIQMRNMKRPTKLDEALSWRDNDDLASKWATDALAAWSKLSGEVRPGVRETERLYSGQCNHGIPFGQPCVGCDR